MNYQLQHTDYHKAEIVTQQAAAYIKAAKTIYELNQLKPEIRALMRKLPDEQMYELDSLLSGRETEILEKFGAR